jgi:hypothetical protein
MSIFGQPKRIAKPFAGVTPQEAYRSGSLGLRGPYQGAPSLRALAAMGQLRGLGALGTATITSQVPWQCWQSADFQTCHAQGYNSAASDCATKAATEFDGNMDNCMITYNDLYDAENCEPQYCASSMPAVSQPADVTAIKAIQASLNTQLAAQGFKPIAVDGKIGPATCGAATYISSLNGGTNPLASYLNASTCMTMTYPTRVGTTTPVSVPTLPTTQIVPGQDAPPLINHVWMVPDSQMVQIQSDCNTILAAHGYKPIALTGMLDSPTCGAMRWIKNNTGTDMLSVSGMNCQSYTDPQKLPNSPGSTPTQPGGPGTPVIKPGISSAAMGMGILAALVVGGGYYYAKKKGMV